MGFLMWFSCCWSYLAILWMIIIYYGQIPKLSRLWRAWVDLWVETQHSDFCFISRSINRKMASYIYV